MDQALTYPIIAPVALFAAVLTAYGVFKAINMSPDRASPFSILGRIQVRRQAGAISRE